MKKSLRLPIPMILAIACRTEPLDEAQELKNAVSLLSHARLDARVIEGREVAADTLLGTPARVKVLNDTLLLVVDALPPFFHLVHRRTGAVLTSFGVKGRGPGEFNSAVDVVVVQGSDSRFWAYDVERKFLTLVEIGTPPGPNARLIELKRIGYYHSPLIANDSSVVVLSDSDSSAIVRYDVNTGGAQPLGVGMVFATPTNAPIPATAKRQLSTEVRMCSGRGHRFARFHRLAGRLEVLDTAGRLLNSARVPYQFNPVFQPSPDHGMVVQLNNPEQRSGYQECVAGDRFLLGLFAGRRWASLSVEQRNEFRNATFLHLFSWDGELRGTARLSEPIVGMDLDTTTMELYGVRFRPEPSVVVFDVRALLRGFN